MPGEYLQSLSTEDPSEQISGLLQVASAAGVISIPSARHVIKIVTATATFFNKEVPHADIVDAIHFIENPQESRAMRLVAWSKKLPDFLVEKGKQLYKLDISHRLYKPHLAEDKAIKEFGE